MYPSFESGKTSSLVDASLANASSSTNTGGTGITTELGYGVLAVFEKITTGGVHASPASLPPQQSPGKPIGLDADYYEIKSTADSTGTVTVKIKYDQSKAEGASRDFRMFHQTESGNWEDVTVSVDQVNKYVIGEVSDFSLFTIAALPATGINSNLLIILSLISIGSGIYILREKFSFTDSVD